MLRNREWENYSPARGFTVPSVSGVLACSAAYNEKTPGPAVPPRIFRGYTCRGPEQRNLYYYIFRTVRYRRTSGSDLTATSPSAAAAATRVIVVMYPSVRIIFLLLLFRGSAIAARDIDVAHPGAGSGPGPRRAHCLPAAGVLTWLSSSATAADEDASLRITACKKAARSRG